uniref:Peroxisomal membrane protein PEX13 n=1 Tax=Cuerna arida TaxID=1464854 RepID=A0A1B6FLM4_9HEMI
MTTPQKPWEAQFASLNANFRQNENLIPRMSTGRNVLNSNAPSHYTQPTGSVRPAAVLPQLPPRPPQLATSGVRTNFGMGMAGMGPSMYGGYAGYGGFSGYGNYPGSMYMPGGYTGGYNYGSYGNFGAGFENRFLQVAEESSRNAFQSIESLVRAFTSVSMMLESTYHAMYSSFRAILGVVDNFSRLRAVFAQFISAITILKTIRYFYHRLLYWLGILDNKTQPETVWGSVTAEATDSKVVTYSSWPLITFFGLLFGGPYLISKLYKSKPVDWDPDKGNWVVPGYPYEAVSEAELSFEAQEPLNVAPVELQLQEGNTGWLLARNMQGKVGYVPVTRLRPETRPPVNNVVINSTRNPDVNSTT